MVDGTALLAEMDSARLPSLGDHLIFPSLLKKMFFLFYIIIVHLNANLNFECHFPFLIYKIVSTVGTGMVFVYATDS